MKKQPDNARNRKEGLENEDSSLIPHPSSLLYCGIDIGASAAKLVLIDENQRVVARSIRRSGVDYAATAERCLTDALAAADLAGKRDEGPGNRDEDQHPHSSFILHPSSFPLAGSLSTGYGRDNVPWVDGTATEIACHGKGAFHHFHQAMTVIDIGAQDSKVIHLDATGRRTGFKMNRKCAAGTGAFLEEIAHRLDLPVAELNGLAERSTTESALGSFCTVFAATEVLEKIRAGQQVEDIVKGAFHSVVKRIVEMDAITGALVMTGGVVAHNPLLVTLAADAFQTTPLVPPDPQFAGALGAALLAMERANDEKPER
jgi:(R)-2-hydroxyacyl-CoA dehydratese activating ATPase